ncbi:MAG: hypothetical protein AAF384_03705 [Pseudomonadota bacterium]
MFSLLSASRQPNTGSRFSTLVALLAAISNVFSAEPQLLSDEPLDLRFLSKILGESSLTIGSIQSSSIDAQDIALTAKFDQGTIVVGLSAKLADGDLDSDATFNVREPALALESKARVRALTLSSIGPVRKIGAAGVTDITLNLAGNGDSLGALAASTNGLIEATVGEMTIDSAALKLVDADLLGQLLGPLLGTKKSDKTLVECARLYLPIVDGRGKADALLGAQTKHLKIFGSGEINLDSEEIDIQIEPHQRGTSVGLDVIGVAAMVRVGGTLANPKPTVDGLGVAKTGIKVAAGILTAGASIVAEQVFERVTDGNPCEIPAAQ